MTDESADSDHPKPRPRWFQFDLRLLFVVIAAVAVVLSFEVARRREAASSGFRGTLRKLQVGEPADFRSEANGGYLEVGGSRNGTIAEVGDDFLVIRANYYDWEYVIPFDEIRFIRRYLPTQPSSAKKKTKVPSKTTAASDPFGGLLAPTKTKVPAKTLLQKTNEPFGKISQ